MIKIFTKQKQQLTSDVDVWIVEYQTYKKDVIVSLPEVKTCFQAFTNRNEAKEYERRLNDALKLLGITSLPQPKMYMQEKNSL